MPTTKEAPPHTVTGKAAIGHKPVDEQTPSPSWQDQLREAIATVREVADGINQTVLLGGMSESELRECIRLWRDRDHLPSSDVNFRLGLLDGVGVNRFGLWVREDSHAHWLPHWGPSYLDLRRLLEYLRAPRCRLSEARQVADYVEWATWTGLTAKQTLRLRWCDVRLEFRENAIGLLESLCEITITRANAPSETWRTLALSLPAALLLKYYETFKGGERDVVFPFDLGVLSARWRRCRRFLDVPPNQRALLKDLRLPRAYSAGRDQITGGTFRATKHSNVENAMRYLRMVDVYSNAAEQRQRL